MKKILILGFVLLCLCNKMIAQQVVTSNNTLTQLTTDFLIESKNGKFNWGSVNISLQFNYFKTELCDGIYRSKTKFDIMATCKCAIIPPDCLEHCINCQGGGGGSSTGGGTSSTPSSGGAGTIGSGGTTTVWTITVNLNPFNAPTNVTIPFNNNPPLQGGGGVSIASSGLGPIEPQMDLEDKNTIIRDTSKIDSLLIITEPCDSITKNTALQLQQSLNKIRAANNKIDSLYNSVALTKDTFELGLAASIDTLGTITTTNVKIGSGTSVDIPKGFDFSFHTHHKLLYFPADYGDFYVFHDFIPNWTGKKVPFTGNYIFGADSSLVSYTMSHNTDYNIMQFDFTYPSSFDRNNPKNNLISEGSPLAEIWDDAYQLAKKLLKNDIQTAYLYAGAYTIGKSKMGFKYFKAKDINSPFEQVDVDIIETPTHNILVIKKCN